MNRSIVTLLLPFETRALVAAWPAVHRLAGLDEQGAGAFATVQTSETFRAWLQLAGLATDVVTVERLGRVPSLLWNNAMILADGTVDPLVDDLVAELSFQDARVAARVTCQESRGDAPAPLDDSKVLAEIREAQGSPEAQARTRAWHQSQGREPRVIREGKNRGPPTGSRPKLTPPPPPPPCEAVKLGGSFGGPVVRACGSDASRSTLEPDPEGPKPRYLDDSGAPRKRPVLPPNRTLREGEQPWFLRNRFDRTVQCGTIPSMWYNSPMFTPVMPSGLPTTWTTREGAVLPIRSLGDRHLVNCIAMLRRKGWISRAEYAEYFQSFGGPPNGDMAQYAWEQALDALLSTLVSPWIDALEQEAGRRGLGVPK